MKDTCTGSLAGSPKIMHRVYKYEQGRTVQRGSKLGEDVELKAIFVLHLEQVLFRSLAATAGLCADDLGEALAHAVPEARMKESRQSLREIATL